MNTVLNITDCDRLWMQVLAARSARIKAQKQEMDLIDRFAKEAKRTAEVQAHNIHELLREADVCDPLIGEEHQS